MKNNWQKIILSKVAVFESGKRMLGGRQKNGDVLSIGGEHISIDGSLDLSSKNYLSLDFYHKLKNGKIFDNDILMVKDGATTGKTIFLKKLPTKFLAVNEHVFIIRSKNEDLLNQYLYYCLISREGVVKIKLQKHGLIGGINKRNLDSIEILYPPKPTQQKIVKVLDSIQTEIGQQKEIIEKTKELKKSLMKKLFSEGVRGEKLKETKIGKMPVSWDVGLLKSLATVVYGKSNPNDQGLYPIFGSSGIYGNTNQILFNKPTIIIGRKGTAGASYYYNGPCWVSDTAFYLDINTSLVEPKFLYLCLDFFKFRISGKHDKTTLPSLKRQDLENFKFPLPQNIIEQKEIASILEKVDAKIESAQKQKKLYEELFNNSLNKLMTQEIEVENINL